MKVNEIKNNTFKKFKKNEVYINKKNLRNFKNKKTNIFFINFLIN